MEYQEVKGAKKLPEYELTVLLNFSIVASGIVPSAIIFLLPSLC